MQEFPVSLKCVSSVHDIGEALKFGFSYYPIVNLSGAVVGSIPYNFLIVLIKNRAWYSKSMSESSKRYLEIFEEEENDIDEMEKHFHDKSDLDTLNKSLDNDGFQLKKTITKKTMQKASFVNEVVVKKEIANLIEKK